MKLDAYSSSRVLLVAILSLLICEVRQCPAAGVTVITHGYDSDVNSWVTAMADDIPAYLNFPGASFTTYKITLTTDGTSLFYQWSRTNGSPPTVTDSGEILVKLDWSQLAGGSAPYDLSTSNVAVAATYVLLQTNIISELNGHALAEFPLHLVGHSRGGSLISEISRLLGTNGVWVDQLTTLDPHPLNNDGFTDPLPVVDASVKTYVNVLFHDNDYETENFYPHGEQVAGAYVRFLSGLTGGYSSAHSDVHLWYHGTLDWRVPTSDSSASLTATQRTNWWVSYENAGHIAGFYYGLIGGGDRLSTDHPLGVGFPAVRDGFNQWWDLGAGTSSNRVNLSTNFGNWPNLILFNRTATNQVLQGQSTPLRFYYQWARPSSTNAIVSIYLDDDFNPLNTNQTLLKQITVPGNGASVSFAVTNTTLSASNAAPGLHSFFAKITGGGQTRYLYAPELVQVIPSQTPPVLAIAWFSANQFRISVTGQPGQTIILQNSTNFASWFPLATNTLSSTVWLYTNIPPANDTQRFYRAVLGP